MPSSPATSTQTFRDRVVGEFASPARSEPERETKSLRIAVAPTIRLTDEPYADGPFPLWVSARPPLPVVRASRPKPRGVASARPTIGRVRARALRPTQHAFERGQVITRCERRFSFAQRIVWRSVGLAGIAASACVLEALGASWMASALGGVCATASWIELRLGWARLSRRATVLTTTALVVSVTTVLAHGLRWILRTF
jgi:hypothetical protein